MRQATLLPLVAVLALSATSVAQPGPVLMTEKVTHYIYDADGALTRVMVTETGQSPVTTTLTWDNYDPAATEPVRAANGNLLEVQSPDASQSYGFDARDRLIGAQAQGQTARYTYDPRSRVGLVRNRA